MTRREKRMNAFEIVNQKFFAWVADHDSPVDTIQGFVETYMDARGVKGSWESLIYFDDPDKMHQIRQFAEHAPDSTFIDGPQMVDQCEGLLCEAILAGFESRV